MILLLAIAACAPDGAEGLETVASLDGEVTWEVDFDAEAEAAGFSDCSYTRGYGGGVEDRSAPWRCPGCDVQFDVLTSMTSGKDDCYAQFSTDVREFVEWMGTSPDTWFRTGWPNAPLSAIGDLTPTASGFDVAAVAESPMETGALTFHIAGSFTVGETLADPLRGYAPPETYACGWPSADPPAYTGDYTLEVGATVPDGVFVDACAEPVRLHDLAGQWWVLDISAADCGPCIEATSGEAAFHDALAGTDAANTPIVTLLSASLATGDAADQALLAAWRQELGGEGPLLIDRGYGLGVVASGVDAAGGNFGYPTFVLVSPDLEVTWFDVGYGASTWTSIAERITGG